MIFIGYSLLTRIYNPILKKQGFSGEHQNSAEDRQLASNNSLDNITT